MDAVCDAQCAYMLVWQAFSRDDSSAAPSQGRCSQKPCSGDSILFVKHAIGHKVDLPAVLPASAFCGAARVTDFEVKFDEALRVRES